MIGWFGRSGTGYRHGMDCPECGKQMTWTPNEEDVEGGWFECPENHRYRKGPHLRPIPVS